MKFKGFSYEDGRMIKTAYLDGYHFGDTLLEGVVFKIDIDEKGKLTAKLNDPDGDYEKGLNQKKWNKAAREFAEEYDIFSDNHNLDIGVEVVLEKEQ